MTAPFIWFVQQIPVPYTSLRPDQFDADLGWVIEPAVDGSLAVRLSRPADPKQNLPAIAPFVVRGVAYTMPEAPREGTPDLSRPAGTLDVPRTRKR